jgi:hypothetical protein
MAHHSCYPISVEPARRPEPENEVSDDKKRKYRFLAEHLRERFGCRVQKVPLDAGFTCPNRDGTLSSEGCVFCNESGSGTGLSERGLGLAEQWAEITPALARKYKTDAFMAYLQSFTNTYGPIGRLSAMMETIKSLPGVKGLCIGTRPDCIDENKLDVLSDAGFEELWLEMGLQSSNDITLQRINRGHNAACFARASRMAARRGVPVCAHLIAGLPGEGRKEFLASVDFVAGLPVSGVKFHNLYVCRGTAAAGLLERGELNPLDREEYAAWVVEALDRLAPGTVIHRLVSDPGREELLAPDWAADKGATLELIHSRIGVRNT